MKMLMAVFTVMLTVSLATTVHAASDAPTFHSPLDQWQVTSPYGPRTHPTTGQRESHAGIDLRAPVGTPVRPVAAGRVHAAYRDANAGWVLILTHGEYESHYYHLSQINVRWGQNVDRGTIVAQTGATGRVSGPHLHLAIKFQGVALDPERHVQPLPLPSWGNLPPHQIGPKGGFDLVHPPYPGAERTYRDGGRYWVWSNNGWTGYLVQQGRQLIRYSRLAPENPTAVYMINKAYRGSDGKMRWEGECTHVGGKKEPWHCVWR